MRKIERINLDFTRFVYSTVLEKSLFTIILTAIISAIVIKYFDNIISLITNPYTIGFLLILLLLYCILSYEKVIQKVLLKDKNFDKDWTNHELRANVPSAAFIADNALQLQFMDIPFMLNLELPDKYALEFKTKVINDVFAWCVNTTVNGEKAEGYMFQYSPIAKVLRPHFIWAYDDPAKTELRWVTPSDADFSDQAPLKSVRNLSLKNRDGWYFLRTEVKNYKKSVKLSDVATAVNMPKLKDSAMNDVPINLDRRNNVVEIKIYDMNDLGKEIYHNFFNEPPLKCFVGGNIGFRNCNYESALYKEIVLKNI